MSDDVARLAEEIQRLTPDPKERKGFLQALVAAAWPGLPSYSTLQAPVIEEVQKATVGTGIVPVFRENGIVKAVVVKAGTHYQSPHYDADPDKPIYMISGGFLNLTQTPGTALVPADAAKAEDPRTGAVRELEEEIVDDKGNPILTIDPKRLKPMDTKMLTFPWGERRAVTGFMLELAKPEVAKIKAHVARLENDAEYRHAMREHTINKETGKPEVCTVSILPLAEIAAGKHALLYPDQQSLFKLIGDALSPRGFRRA